MLTITISQAVGQICSTASMANNLGQCRQLIQKAIAAGAKVNLIRHISNKPKLMLESLQALFLPEASDYIAGSAAETVSLVRPVQESEFVLGLQEEARRAKLPINVGVHEPANGGKRVKNTLLWIDETGDIVQRYQKLHLFDIEIEGGPIIRESDSVEPGSSILPPFHTAVGRVGLMICFDVCCSCHSDKVDFDTV